MRIFDKRKTKFMYLFFDTETNGLPRNWKAPLTDLHNWPRLVQIAWILFDEKGNELDRNDHIVIPVGFTIPPSASKVHGISDQRAKEEGIDLSIVLNEMHQQIQKADYMVAHNLAFDEKIIGAEFLRQSMLNSLASKKRICTMEATVDYCKIPGKYGFKWPKLIELHTKLFGKGFDGAHNAAADIDATANCFWELKKRGVI